jgi:hypothetical protein
MKIVGIIGIILIAIAVIFVFAYISTKMYEKFWNGGYCPDCGEKWDAITSNGHVYVSCPKCGRTACY